MFSFPRGTLTSPSTVCLENLSKSLTCYTETINHENYSLIHQFRLNLLQSVSLLFGKIIDYIMQVIFGWSGTSILRVMRLIMSLLSCRMQLNWSPYKGLQLPFTMRVRHSCSTVHSTDGVA